MERVPDIDAIQMLSLCITAGDKPGELEWEQYQKVETLVRRWRYGIQPAPETQQHLQLLCSRVRQQKIDKDNTLALGLRILFGYCPTQKLARQLNAKEVDALTEETKTVTGFLLMFVRQQHETTQAQESLLAHMIELRLLNHCHVPEDRHALINRVLAEVEGFFDTLNSAYAELARERDDVATLDIDAIDTCLHAKFSSHESEPETAAIQRWYNQHMICAEELNPHGIDEPLHEWARHELPQLFDALLSNMLSHPFLASAMHERLTNSDRYIPPYAKGADWTSQQNGELTQRLGNLVVAGVRMVYGGEKSLAESLAKGFKKIIAAVMKRRVQQLSPMLLHPGMMGKWADTLHHLVQSSLNLNAEQQKSLPDAVKAAVHHVQEIHTQHSSAIVRTVLASQTVSSRVTPLTERLAEMLFYSRTVRWFLIRHLIRAL